jgi:hypothetical protein
MDRLIIWLIFVVDIAFFDKFWPLKCEIYFARDLITFNNINLMALLAQYD